MRTPAQDRLIDRAGDLCRAVHADYDQMGQFPGERVIQLMNETREAIREVLDETGGVMGMTVRPLTEDDRPINKYRSGPNQWPGV